MTLKSINRIMYGIIILFCVTPFLFLVYANMTATMQSITLVELLQSNAVITLQMLSIFLLPLAAYLLKLKWDYFNQESELESSQVLYTSIVIIMLAMFMLNNIVHGFLMLILLVFITKYYSISVKNVYQTLKKMGYKGLLKTFSGELVLVVLSILVGIMIRQFI